VANAFDTNPAVSVSSIPSSSSLKAAYPSSSRSCSLQSDPSSSRKARRSPGYQLSRQVSDSRIPSLKSLNESGNCSPDSRQSFVLSVCSNDLSAGGSHGGSSDGWSMRAFTELVAASSQRERWSLDSENLSALNSKTVGSSPSSADLQTCRVCSKLLTEKSPWSAQKIVSTNELSVAAVLVCGHVYHADCLESITSETDRYDPPCPVCTNGERLMQKLLTKADSKARNKIFRRVAADIDMDGDSAAPEPHKWGVKSPSMGASSSMKGRQPFLRRHFSIGSRPPPARSVSESEASRKKKGFWSRYRRD